MRERSDVLRMYRESLHWGREGEEGGEGGWREESRVGGGWVGEEERRVGGGWVGGGEEGRGKEGGEGHIMNSKQDTCSECQ